MAEWYVLEGENGERVRMVRERGKKKLIEDIHFIANTETSRICK